MFPVDAGFVCDKSRDSCPAGVNDYWDALYLKRNIDTSQILLGHHMTDLTK